MKMCILMVLAGFFRLTVVMGQPLTYQLMSDSTITPASEGIPTGPSQPLTGYFTWVFYSSTGIVGSEDFNITALSFDSPSYALTLASGAQPDNTTEIGADGQTTLNANVNLAGSPTNPWYLGAYGSGSYTGSATAPTQLTFSSEGLYSPVNGDNDAILFIDAQLVDSPLAAGQVTNILTVTATAQLQGGTNVSLAVTTILEPTRYAVDTRHILLWLAEDEHAEGHYGSATFPADAQLAAIGSDFEVLDGNKKLLVDVSDILTGQSGTNSVIAGRVTDRTRLYDPTATELQIFTLTFDDSPIVGGVGIKFYLLGLMTNKITDTAPDKKGIYKESLSSDMPVAVGEGNFQGTPFVISGSLKSAGETTLEQ
jgi:hypothetical protein